MVVRECLAVDVDYECRVVSLCRAALALGCNCRTDISGGGHRNVPRPGACALRKATAKAFFVASSTGATGRDDPMRVIPATWQRVAR